MPHRQWLDQPARRRILSPPKPGCGCCHVAYRGGVPAALDVAGGRVDLFFANIAEVAEMVRGGQIRALALAADAPSPLCRTCRC